MANPDNEFELKVVDRRRFVQDGEEIKENPDEQKAWELRHPPRPEAAAPAGTGGQQSPSSPAGQPAQQPSQQPSQAQQPPSAPPSGSASGPQGGTKPASGEAEQGASAAQRRADQAAAGLPPADFMTMLQVLVQEASQYLGEPDPMGRVGEANLPVAAMFIDLIGVLKEKTQGNLTFEESQALDQLLSALRLRYVQKRS